MMITGFLLFTSILPLSHGFVPSSHQETIKVSTRLSSKVEKRPGDAVPPPTFPLSTRQALLIKRAKELGVDQPGSYSTVGWSNRLGSVLTPVAPEGVYAADRPFYWNKIDVGCRMTVIELPATSGTTSKPDLWLHSPVGIDGPLQAKLDEIGTVKHIVSPNYEHVKFAKQWANAYPEANMWACPGMMEKEPDVRWKGEIPFGCRPESWSGTATTTTYPPNFWDTSLIQPLHIDTESVPLLNIAFFNEVIFYHAPSKTLLTTDLYWNYPAPNGVPNSNYIPSEENGPWPLSPSIENVPIGSKLWKRAMDQVYKPFYMNLMVKDASKFDEIVNFLVKEGEWSKMTTVVPAHGDVIRGQGFIRALLAKHFNLE